MKKWYIDHTQHHYYAVVMAKNLPKFWYFTGHQTTYMKLSVL